MRLEQKATKETEMKRTGMTMKTNQTPSARGERQGVPDPKSEARSPKIEVGDVGCSVPGAILHPPPCILVFPVLLLALTGSALGTVRYVDANSAHPSPPYIGWATAATNIQDAVDVAVAAEEVVVTNGVYATGGRASGTNILESRVAAGCGLLTGDHRLLIRIEVTPEAMRLK
jgi:hypothetical protein